MCENNMRDLKSYIEFYRGLEKHHDKMKIEILQRRIAPEKELSRRKNCCGGK
jgi:hypothetical protein